MLIQADARQIPLRDGCVQCVVTSPPYFGLRDYGISQQIGLEPTPSDYIAQLVAVFREVGRVLKDDGTAWLNLGDSYAAGGKGGGGSFMAERRDAAWQKQSALNGWRRQPEGCKEKDLLGIPWAVAFALRDAGWYLRSDVIWHKPNPMPESVTDRPTKSHEYLFLLTKSERYYYDAKAIAEKAGEFRGTVLSNRESGTGKARGMDGQADRQGNFRPLESGRNKRSVWTIPTLPEAGAHFATMPEALVEPCVLAGSRLGDLVFDPFSGSGTVLAVSERLGRLAVGTDLNPAYHALAKKRTAQRGLRWDGESA